MKTYNYVCEICKKEFSLPYKKQGKHIYCSLECSIEAKRKKIEQICPVCNKKFYITPSSSYRICCSKECKHIYQIGKPNLKERKYNFLDTPAIENDLYKKWRNMKNRCYQPSCERYEIYGARGIKICDEWLDDFTNFYNWAMENGYKKGLTIERIDVNGNYCPENCTWVTMKEQSKNRRTNVWVEYNNRKMILSEVAKLEYLEYNNLRRLYRKFNDINKAVLIAKEKLNNKEVT